MIPVATPRDDHDGTFVAPTPVSRSGAGDASDGALGVLIPISVAGWLLFGASCILCINGKGRAGRWVPEWYLDSGGKRRDMAMVGAWWLAVMLLWPIILPVLLVGKLVKSAKRAACKRKKRQDDEEAQVSEAKNGTQQDCVERH